MRCRVEGLFGRSQWSSATVSQTIVCEATVPDAYAGLPADPTDEELTRDWTLKADDRVEIHRCRGDANRHRFAIQLCALRTLGRFVDDVPVRIANHVGRQLGLPPSLFAAPPDRAATDTGHAQRIRAYLHCFHEKAARCQMCPVPWDVSRSH